MTGWQARGMGTWTHRMATGLFLVAAVAGCSKPAAPADQAATAPTAPSPAAATQAATPAQPAPDQQTAAAPVEPRLQQAFAEATRADPPAGWQRPPDVTLTGKSVGKLYTDVVALWDTIRFTTPDGRRIFYSATLDTELGPIEMALLPELAPNHVRNFIALARAGYYDGLVFERTVHEKVDGQPDLELIEAGCPLGTGEVGHGSIGYWLNPEFSPEAHVEGTVGACHAEEPDTACCKFYITLTKAPFLDNHFTVFARVTSGLDVARKIFSLPVRNDPDYPEGDRPEKPVVIRKVTIQAKE